MNLTKSQLKQMIEEMLTAELNSKARSAKISPRKKTPDLKQMIREEMGHLLSEQSEAEKIIKSHERSKAAANNPLNKFMKQTLQKVKPKEKKKPTDLGRGTVKPLRKRKGIATKKKEPVKRSDPDYWKKTDIKNVWGQVHRMKKKADAGDLSVHDAKLYKQLQARTKKEDPTNPKSKWNKRWVAGLRKDAGTEEEQKARKGRVSKLSPELQKARNAIMSGKGGTAAYSALKRLIPDKAARKQFQADMEGDAAHQVGLEQPGYSDIKKAPKHVQHFHSLNKKEKAEVRKTLSPAQRKQVDQYSHQAPARKQLSPPGADVKPQGIDKFKGMKKPTKKPTPDTMAPKLGKKESEKERRIKLSKSEQDPITKRFNMLPMAMQKVYKKAQGGDKKAIALLKKYKSTPTPHKDMARNYKQVKAAARSGDPEAQAKLKNWQKQKRSFTGRTDVPGSNVPIVGPLLNKIWPKQGVAMPGGDQLLKDIGQGKRIQDYRENPNWNQKSVPAKSGLDRYADKNPTMSAPRYTGASQPGSASQITSKQFDFDPDKEAAKRKGIPVPDKAVT